MPGLFGLSGEQFKRLTIAIKLVANPSIIFCDEPTSGLDARAAQIVMRVVRNIVNNNRTVVCTIHQPSAEIFLHFDELLLLKRGGSTIYYGPLGEESEMLVNYFQSVDARSSSRAATTPRLTCSRCAFTCAGSGTLHAPLLDAHVCPCVGPCTRAPAHITKFNS
jgi:ABC-type multidrug transport system ATPase subunit